MKVRNNPINLIWHGVLTLTSLLMLVGFAGCADESAVLRKATDLVTPYIVQIVLVVDNQKLATLGTALLINEDGYAVTADHILAIGEQQLSQIQSDNKKMAIVVPTPQGAGSVAPEPSIPPVNGFQIIDRDELHDIALLRLEMTQIANPLSGQIKPTLRYYNGLIGTLSIEPVKLTSRNPKNGDRIGVSGYPNQGVELVTESGVVTSGVEGFRNLGLYGANDRFIDRDLTEYCMTDVTPKSLSGAPVYLLNGSIIGLEIESVGGMGGTKETLLIPVSFLLRLVDRNGIVHR